MIHFIDGNYVGPVGDHRFGIVQVDFVEDGIAVENERSHPRHRHRLVGGVSNDVPDWTRF